MTVPGDHWPILLYAGFVYDAEDPWKGLFRSPILVSVSLLSMEIIYFADVLVTGIQTRLYLTQLRGERGEGYALGQCANPWNDARHSRFDRIHRNPGECVVTFDWASLLYLTHLFSQARFSLSSSSVFSRTDTLTDSERFYNSILELFDDAEEKEEVDDLLVWWNRYESVILLWMAH